MEMKKYHDVVRYGHRTTVDVLNKGDYITITEKIDGANASFRRDGNIIRAYSRNHELNEENNLGGFYQWVKEKDFYISEGLIFFGEWINPHKVKYSEHTKEFFLYDVYDLVEERYMSFKTVKAFANILGINTVPVFYEGEYQSFEHLQSFVGKSALGGMLGDTPTGEGIVVKNVDYKDRYGRQVFVKLVTESFREVQKQKAPKDPTKITPEEEFVNSCMTEARVEKLLYKLVDEGILDEHFGIEDMGLILKQLNTRVYDDILKEESDMLKEIKETSEINIKDGYIGKVESVELEEKLIRKAISKNIAKIVKKIIQV